MSNSFTFNGVDMGGTSYGLTVVGLKMQSLAAPLIDARQLVNGFGGMSLCLGYGSKAIALETVMDIPASGATQQSRIDAIKAALDPRVYGAKKLALDVFSDRYWYATLNGPVDEGKINALAGKFALEFIAPDSRAFSTTNRTSPDFTITSNPQTFTTESVAGTAPCSLDLSAPSLCPVWIVKNTSGGTVSSMSFGNATTGESITITNSIANGSWIRLSVGTQKVEKSTNSGSSYTSVLTGVTPGGIIPSLSPGVNTITLTGFSGATVTLAYTARYL